MDWKNYKQWKQGTAENVISNKYYAHWEPLRIGTTAFSDATTYSVTCDTTYASAVSTYVYDNSPITTYIARAETIIRDMTFYGDGASIYFGAGTHAVFTGTPETEEQRAARIAMEEKYAAEVKKADHVARMMFIRIVGTEKYRLLKRLGHFDIVGKTGQRYRLAVGEKVRVMHGCFGDQVKHKLCAYVPDVPQVDTLIAQYLALTSGEKGEEEFGKIAIKHAA
jgi:hypothetical protein